MRFTAPMCRISLGFPRFIPGTHQLNTIYMTAFFRWRHAGLYPRSYAWNGLDGMVYVQLVLFFYNGWLPVIFEKVLRKLIFPKLACRTENPHSKFFEKPLHVLVLQKNGARLPAIFVIVRLAIFILQLLQIHLEFMAISKVNFCFVCTNSFTSSRI